MRRGDQKAARAACMHRNYQTGLGYNYPPPLQNQAILRSYGKSTLISKCVPMRFYGDCGVHGVELFSGGMLKRNTVLPSFVR